MIQKIEMITKSARNSEEYRKYRNTGFNNVINAYILKLNNNPSNQDYIDFYDYVESIKHNNILSFELIHKINELLFDETINAKLNKILEARKFKLI